MSVARESRLALFAITTPGLESIAASELRAVGIVPRRTQAGGVSFEGPLETVYRANLWSRTVSRVIARVGEFHAASFSELEKRTRRLPWERFVSPDGALRLHVTCRKSRLYHSDAVGERVAGAIEGRVGGTGAPHSLGAGDEDSDQPGDQLVVVRLLHDRCTVSIDSSGALLHRRGYRLATAKAPLRETLAAAALLASEWRPDAPLLDPMCGSGTIPIEAALIARRIAPGVRRRFAFEHWPERDPGRWSALIEEASSRALARAPAPIQGSDRDAGAIDAARANAERAGVAADVELVRRPISAIEPPAGAGWIVTNPPYGTRVGERDALRDLYATLGTVVRRRCPGWSVSMISASARLERQTGLAFQELARTRSGGIPVRLLRAIA
ncbi:MAG TPA: class I SAM-dependent RNA methyltransferase [Gemmatimonadaceae bacterium]|nr:class I SAM-dependent RNA methyltransferase [Gemmatimonadaceae bacterium]